MSNFRNENITVQKYRTNMADRNLVVFAYSQNLPQHLFDSYRSTCNERSNTGEMSHATSNDTNTCQNFDSCPLIDIFWYRITTILFITFSYFSNKHDRSWFKCKILFMNYVSTVTEKDGIFQNICCLCEFLEQ